MKFRRKNKQIGTKKQNIIFQLLVTYTDCQFSQNPNIEN